MTKRARGSFVEETRVIGEYVKFDSGVEATLLPFPLGLYQKISDQGDERFPLPIPPKKEIEVVDGKEIIDDFDDLEYLTALSEANMARRKYVATTAADYAVDMCCVLHDWPEKWEPIVKRLSKYIDFPEDPDERRITFIENYALATGADYSKLVSIPIALSSVDDVEVMKRLKSFQGNMAGAASGNAEASSVNGEGEMAVS